MGIVIDAENKVLGRVAAYAAKQAMNGFKVDIVNSEKAIITGTRAEVLAKYKNKRSRGVPKKGPHFPTQSDRFMRRTVRGMLPYKKPRGKEAFGNVMAHIGVPEELEKEKKVDIEEADISKLTNLKYVYVGEVCKELKLRV